MAHQLRDCGMLGRKLTKALRKWRWVWPGGDSLPLRWHVGHPNFGDDINPYFFQKLLGRPVRFVRRSEAHLLGIGSILNASAPGSVVVGCGLLTPGMAPGMDSVARIVSLRGHLTAEAIGFDPGHYGDPAVLVARLFPRQQTAQFRLGVIPHHTRAAVCRRLIGRDTLFIDPAWHPLKVLDAINQCSGILSQSLHGLIIADAYGVPNGWLAPEEGMVGGEFKFADYYGTTRDPKRPLPTLSIGKLLDAKDLELFVSAYRFDLEGYQSHLVKEIVREFGDAALRAVA
jgi:pyruvyltransferase